MRTLTLIAAAAVSLSACSDEGQVAQSNATARHPPMAAQIMFSTMGCYGDCPLYTVAVDTTTGVSTFSGGLHTATFDAGGSLEVPFRATPAQVRAFSDAVADLRTLAGNGLVEGSPGCVHWRTDNESLLVMWTSADGKTTVKRAYFGCYDTESQRLLASLRSVSEVLPIKALIGR